VPEIETAKSSVLSTLNPDGSRRWLRPKPSRGRFWRRRLLVAWGLIGLFTALPYLRLNGRPLVLLDIPSREFSLFGSVFLPTDTLLLALLVVSMFVTIFLLTALLFGRVWCGWACPQTVYMEFLYRPDRAVLRRRARSAAQDRALAQGAEVRRVPAGQHVPGAHVSGVLRGRGAAGACG
jgi:hypothetical protein